jgi:hypothetical protein
MGREKCSSTSITRAKLLKESRSVQLMLIWSYLQKEKLLFYLRNQLMFNIRNCWFGIEYIPIVAYHLPCTNASSNGLEIQWRWSKERLP